MKYIIPIISSMFMFTSANAERYSDTGFEEVAEDYVVLTLSSPRKMATINFRTVCDPIYGSDSANCSVRLYDGLRGDSPGEYINTILLECDISCIVRKE